MILLGIFIWAISTGHPMVAFFLFVRFILSVQDVKDVKVEEK